MTYQYQVVATGQVIEVEQRITEDAHKVLEVDGELVTVQRLISAPGAFVLKSGPSGGWSGSGYGHTPGQLSAMRTLGRPLTKRGE